MSGLDGLQLDADGFLDMDQYPDDGTDLDGPELDQLRETLHADPVDEPTAEQWDAMFDDVVSTGDDGPFALDDGGADGTYEPFETSTPDSDDILDPDDAPDASDADLDGDSDDLPVDTADLDASDDLAFDTADLDLDPADLDGGLDLAPADEVDDVFTSTDVDDAAAEVANNDFEDLL